MRQWLPIIACALALTAGVAYLGYRPAAAQTKDDPKSADRLAAIEKRLERMEIALRDIQQELKTLQPQKAGWQKLSAPEDKGEYILMMEFSTGKVKAIRKSDGATYDK